MHTGIRSCAATAALFLLTVGLGAQDPALAAHLAAAKIAESRGDLAAAESELVAASALATGEDRARAEQALLLLRQKLGRGGESGPDANRGDPVQRCILALDSPDANSAVDQLGGLGRLVAPQLLAALPKLGAFGVRNAVHLLGAWADESIRDTLLRAIDGSDRNIIAAIEQNLEQMVPDIALPVAQKLATADVGPDTRFAALRVLLRLDPERGAAEALAQELTVPEAANVHRGLLAALAMARPSWQLHVLDALWQSGSGRIRAGVLGLRIAVDPQFDEDRCLRDLDTLGQELWYQAACEGPVQHAEWVRFGARVLGAVAKVGPKNSVPGIVQAWEWWRQPAVAAPVLCTPEVVRQAEGAMWAACVRMSDQGWWMPPESEDMLAELADRRNDWSNIVAMLPAASEERAFALADRLGTGPRARFVVAVAKSGRPWHRLIARQLAQVARAEDLDLDLLAIDWTGASPEVVQDLVTFARRYPRLAGSGVVCDDRMIAMFLRHREVPAEFLFSLVADGNGNAFDAIATRDPRAALAWAAQADHLTDAIAAKACQHLFAVGDAADVPLAVRLCRRGVFPGEDSGANLINFFAANGGGDLAAIRLGALPLPPDRFTTHWCIEAAQAAAQGARRQDLAALLELLPRLHVLVAQTLVARLEGLSLEPGDAATLGVALREVLSRPVTNCSSGSTEERVAMGTTNLTVALCAALARCGNPAALDGLRQAMLHSDGWVRSSAAEAALAIAGGERRRLVEELLAAEHCELVAEAIELPEVAADEGLRGKAMAALMRIQGHVHGTDTFFENLQADARDAFARRVLEHEPIAGLEGGLLMPALRTLGQRRDASGLPSLLKAVRHPHARVRQEVAIQLGNTYAKEAAPQLIEMLKDDPDVRRSAQAALDQIAQYLDECDKWAKRFGK